ncbi:MAG: aspartate carbamoyltransferase catalytic subunit [Xanthomonadales bacterium]|nr:aspartate carbamoyltransferase catalytic subunit [Xanthomonadales bacterium]
MSGIQLGAGGRLRHLLTLEGLPAGLLGELLDLAQAFRDSHERGVKAMPLLRGRTMVGLFFEPSTRTRVSFEIAARRLSAEVIHFDLAQSSARKGESAQDTVATLAALGCDLFIVRHHAAGAAAHLAERLPEGCALINAGDGEHAHPTQGLLDALTIRQRKGGFEGLVVAILGDIRHSRVARSDIHALRTLGVAEIRLCGPPQLLPERVPEGCRVEPEADRAVAGADVIIALRLQKERMEAGLVPSEAEYFRDYGIDAARLRRARPDAIVMHPGPMNRGIEIASEVADGPQSVILEQVANGVFVRMAVMARLAGAR